RQQIGQPGGAQFLPREKPGFRSDPGELVPRADRQAVVAAIDAVAYRAAELVWDRPLVLNGQIGDAAAGIEPVRGGKGVGRACIQAGATGAAMVFLATVRFQFGSGEDRTQKQPGAMAAADQIGMLALPAQP